MKGKGSQSRLSPLSAGSGGLLVGGSLVLAGGGTQSISSLARDGRSRRATGSDFRRKRRRRGRNNCK